MLEIRILARRLYEYINSLFQTKYKYEMVEDLPEVIGKNRIFIIGDSSEPWALAFQCPCGCKEVIQLNLLKEASPRWKYKIVSKKQISIQPSIWRKHGCKSHFFIRRSQVQWA